MQQTEAAAASSSLLYVYPDDLELPQPLACDKSPDLVASVVHVSTEGKVPLRTITTTTTPVRTRYAASTTEREQRQNLQLHLLTGHQYVGAPVDQQHQLQISPIASPLPSTEAATATSTYSSQDSPALDSARLTEPFTPIYPLNDSEVEESIPATLRQDTYIPPSQSTNPASPNIFNNPSASPNQPEFEGTAATSPRRKSRMFFGDLQKSSAAAHRRRSMATTSALTDYEADLTSKDRMKQKDAIKKVLAGKVRDDWEWTWPRDDNEPMTPIVNRSQESLASEEWKERDEWISNASASEDESGPTLGTPTVANAANGKDPFRFDNPDGVGDSVRKSAEDRKARRRRRLYEEMRVNDGLSCFTHRRNAWTCARHVRRVPRTATLKRTLSRPTSKPSPAAIVPATPSSNDDVAEMITEIRIAPPILPPDTPMRKGINERAYTTIYDKVILQSQTPFCPINLSVVMKSCVEGWKRDGEWPPKAGEMESIIAGVRRTGIGVDLGRRDADTKDENGSGSKGRSVLRRSLQKVMGAVRERAGSRGKDDEVV